MDDVNNREPWEKSLVLCNKVLKAMLNSIVFLLEIWENEQRLA